MNGPRGWSSPVPDLQSPAAVAKMVDKVQEDMAGAIEHLRQGLEVMRALEAPARGINGLASFLKSQSTALDAMIDNMADESAKVAKTLLDKGELPAVKIVVKDGERIAERVAS